MMLSHFFKKFQNIYPGLILSVILAAISTALAGKYEAPVMLFALLLGLSLHFFSNNTRYSQGIDFSSHSLLRFSVALLGLRISFDDIISLGMTPLLVVSCSMVLTIFFAVILAHFLKLPKAFGVLSGGSVAVCGVSAAAALVTVLPKKDLEEKFFALTVIAVTAYGTMAMVIYPLIINFLDLPYDLAGIFLGGSIHDVAQVVGASYSVSEETGDIATFIKLLRVALLLPIVLVVFFIFKDKDSTLKGGITSLVPLFLLGFFLLAIVNNLGWFPMGIVEAAKGLSSFFLVISIAAIGMRTSLQEVVQVGWKAILLISLESLFIATLILVGIYFFEI